MLSFLEKLVLCSNNQKPEDESWNSSPKTPTTSSKDITRAIPSGDQGRDIAEGQSKDIITGHPQATLTPHLSDAGAFASPELFALHTL